jgi:hypothetical protein
LLLFRERNLHTSASLLEVLLGYGLAKLFGPGERGFGGSPFRQRRDDLGTLSFQAGRHQFQLVELCDQVDRLIAKH